jgi:hypothetical protein
MNALQNTVMVKRERIRASLAVQGFRLRSQTAIQPLK